MNKKLIYSAAALALLGASCSQEDVAPIGQDGMTTLSITIPGELTSRYGDVAETPALYLAIYKAGTTDLLFSTFTNTPKNESSITGGDFGAPADNTNIRTATVQVPLVKGMAYDIVCWAQNPEVTDYTFNADQKTISVTYGTTNTIGNYAEKRDAFFGQALNFVSEGKGAEITLTRPFAQINVGTSDWTKYTAAGGSADNPFGLTITGVANTLNLTNGEITAPETTATITVTGATTESNTDAFPAGTEYTYLAMAYVLANQNLTVGLTGMGDGYDAWRNVPVKANYRTNIYGTLLTNAEDFTITLDPNFGGFTDYDPTTGDRVNYVAVTTPEEFVAAFNSDSNNVYVPAGTTIDFSKATDVKTDFNTPQTMLVDGTITNIDKILHFDDGLTLTGNGVLEVDVAVEGAGIICGSPSSYQTFGDLTMDGVTIRSTNDSESTGASLIFESHSLDKIYMKNVVIENNSGYAAQLEADNGVTVENCKFYATRPKGVPYAVTLAAYGNCEIIFNNCEIVGPMGIFAAAGNAGGGNSSLNYKMNFNGCTVIATDTQFDIEQSGEEDGLGICGLFGNGNVTFNNSYLYSASNALIAMTAFFADRNLTFNNCYVNAGATILDGNIINDGNPESVNDKYVFAPLSTAQTKTVNGTLYTFTQSLNGSYTFPKE